MWGGDSSCAGNSSRCLSIICPRLMSVREAGWRHAERPPLCSPPRLGPPSSTKLWKINIPLNRGQRVVWSERSDRFAPIRGMLDILGRGCDITQAVSKQRPQGCVSNTKRQLNSQKTLTPRERWSELPLKQNSTSAHI